MRAMYGRSGMHLEALDGAHAEGHKAVLDLGGLCGVHVGAGSGVQQHAEVAAAGLTFQP
jgi:hypothetical protein